MNRQKITIAATGLNNTDNPGPGVPFIRGIRESDKFDVRVIGLAYENLEPGIYLEGVADKTYTVPYPSSGSKLLLDRIRYINSIEDIDFIIPNFDAELYTFIKASKQLESMNIKTFLPTIQQLEERHKANLPDFGTKYNLMIPGSKPLTSLNDIHKINTELDFPLYVKGKFYDAYKANNKEQVIIYFNKISAKWGLPVIVQENIEGVEVNVVAIGDGKGNTIGAVPMRKQYITDNGKAWGGITLADEKMLEITRDIISKTKWRGGMELEMIRTKKGEYYIIEINPRLPAWVYLAVGAGQNLPEALVQLGMGMDIEPMISYEVGKMFIRYSMDIITDINVFQKLATTGELEVTKTKNIQQRE
jgi:carbamoyl-phosphate synthase large subunit